MADEGGEEAGGSRRRLTTTTLAIATSVVLLAGNVVQLRYTIDPSARPDPNEQLRATVRPATDEPDVTFGEYLARVTDPSALAPTLTQLARQELRNEPPSLRLTVPCERSHVAARLGYVAYANVTVEGLKHRSVDLYAMLYDARSHRRLAQYRQEGALTPVRLTSPTDSFVAAAFLDVPPEPRKLYYAHFELRAHAAAGDLGTLLAIGDSAPFRGFVAGYPSHYAGC